MKFTSGTTSPISGSAPSASPRAGADSIGLEAIFVTRQKHIGRQSARSLDLVLQYAYARLEIAMGLDVETRVFLYPASIGRARLIFADVGFDLRSLHATGGDEVRRLVDLVLVAFQQSRLGRLTQLRRISDWDMIDTPEGRQDLICDLRGMLQAAGLPRSLMLRLPAPTRGTRAARPTRWAA